MTPDNAATDVYETLNALYPEKLGFLSYRNGYELVIAVILSAQTTDRQVNSITPELFGRYPAPGDLAAAKPEEVIEIIRPTGYFRVKGRNIINAASVLHTRFHDTVPDEMKDLLLLPGVGRKSANVVLGALFGKPAIIVDTHFGRVVRRLGLSSSSSPEQVERDLRKLVPGHRQYRFSMLINYHGRICCQARKPLCTECPLLNVCPWGTSIS